MIKYKGVRKKSKVKMLKKPIMCGFKVWCLACSCCGYLCNFEGKPTDPITGKACTKTGLVKKSSREPFEGLDHVVYLANFFTSGPLVESLRKKGIFSAGTIKQVAKGFPKYLEKCEAPSWRRICVSRGGGRGEGKDVFHDRTVVSFASNVFPQSMKGRVARLPPSGRTYKCQWVPPVLPAFSKRMK